MLPSGGAGETAQNVPRVSGFVFVPHTEKKNNPAERVLINGTLLPKEAKQNKVGETQCFLGAPPGHMTAGDCELEAEGGC